MLFLFIVEQLEMLLSDRSLISGIVYDPTDKKSFFEAVTKWSKKEDFEIKERFVTLTAGFTEACTDAYSLIFYPKAESKDVRPIKRAYYLTAIASQTMLCLGRWGYNPVKREIIKGNEAQRLGVILLGVDPLVHEYLHAYQHILFNSLKSRGLNVTYPIPSSIVEPSVLGFQFRPPSFNYLHRFETKIIKQLVAHNH